MNLVAERISTDAFSNFHIQAESGRHEGASAHRALCREGRTVVLALGRTAISISLSVLWCEGRVVIILSITLKHYSLCTNTEVSQPQLMSVSASCQARPRTKSV
ncbi:hypothetical protein E2C01_002834 [Portunus trituberculatus]|uniref:Uncharacterized protein n=1 Tax=Portunus trituberculatus TaxID=210409 RepID=A0A5B7CRS1_PORTR|nr:hypothetical protein [Portunus trituberculatus]